MTIKDLLSDKGLSIDDLARSVGTDRPTLSDSEKGIDELAGEAPPASAEACGPDTGASVLSSQADQNEEKPAEQAETADATAMTGEEADARISAEEEVQSEAGAEEAESAAAEEEAQSEAGAEEADSAAAEEEAQSQAGAEEAESAAAEEEAQSEAGAEEADSAAAEEEAQSEAGAGEAASAAEEEAQSEAGAGKAESAAAEEETQSEAGAGEADSAAAEEEAARIAAEEEAARIAAEEEAAGIAAAEEAARIAAEEEAARIAAEEKAARKAAKKAAKKRKADEEAVQWVTEAILALGDSVDLDDEDAVNAARDAYDSLTYDQEQLLQGDLLSMLVAAEQMIEEASKTFPIEDCWITVKDVSYSAKKIKKPSVKVELGDMKLKEGEDFTFSYDKKIREPGLYTLTVSGEGRFTGAVDVPFYVVPKAKALIKLLGGDKKASLDWKCLKNIAGIQIEYSRDEDFSDSRKEKIKKARDLDKLAGKLKPGRKYYVRARVYAKVKKKKYFSDWSKVRTLKV